MSKRLTCKQCSYSVESEYTNKEGRQVDGYWKLRWHYEERHVGSFWKIIRALPKIPKDEVLNEEPKLWGKEPEEERELEF